MSKEYEYKEAEFYYVDCEKEEREQRERELAEKQKFVEGMKRYPDMGIPVYIDDKIPEEQDWEKLVMVREDNCFYMADFVENESGGLDSVRWNVVYHGELMSENDKKKKRGRRRKYGE